MKNKANKNRNSNSALACEFGVKSNDSRSSSKNSCKSRSTSKNKYKNR